MIGSPLVFVDLETTGLRPDRDRITEVGLVAVNGGQVTPWSTLVNPGLKVSAGSLRLTGLADDALADAPRFRDVAAKLLGMLQGHLLIAHNARFDVSFLKAEFQRIGHEFDPKVLCSVMLSRRLYPEHKLHDLDSVIERHGLTTSIRHRALPDAQSIWQFWELIQRTHTEERVAATVAELLASPVFPAHLDPALIARLPEQPGVYVLHDTLGAALKVGKASNLRLDLQNYFRLDRLSAKAMAVSHRVADITWQVTRGPLGSGLRLAALGKTCLPAKQIEAARELYSWRLIPETAPSVELVCLTRDTARASASSFGIFNSERKARNALHRIAAKNRLCYSVLGIRQSAANPCAACLTEGIRRDCARGTERLRRLTRTLSALKPIQLEAWPYAGPIGIRERRDLHIFDDWRYMGTATNEAEVHSILEGRSPTFDRGIYALLSKRLPRLRARRIVHLTRKEVACES